MGQRPRRHLPTTYSPWPTAPILGLLALVLPVSPAMSVTAGIPPPAPAAAQAGTTFGATVGLSEIYTDNLTLVENNRQHDFVTLLEPGVTFAHDSQRVKFDLNYLLQFLYFKEAADSTQVFHQLHSELDLTAVQDTLFLDSTVDYTQVIKNPKQPVSYTNVPTIGNLSNALVAETGPVWHQTIFGQDVDAKATYGIVDYGSKELQNVDFQTWFLDVGSPRKDRGLSASLHHEYVRYDYTLSPTRQRQALTGTLTYNVGGGLSVAGTAGRESDFPTPTSAALTSNVWNAGFTNSSPSTDLNFFYGHRSFGPTVNALFRWKLDAGAVLIS